MQVWKYLGYTQTYCVEIKLWNLVQANTEKSQTVTWTSREESQWPKASTRSHFHSGTGPKIITVTRCRLTGKPRLSSNKHLHRCQTIDYGRDYENVCFVGINVPLMSNDTAVNRLYFLSGGASTSEQQSTNRSSSLWSYRIQVKILQFPEALKTDSADGTRVTLYFILFSRRKKK